MMFSQEQAFGLRWEKWAAGQLTERGYPARYHGWLAQYRDNWQALGLVQAVRARRVGQMAMPLEVQLCQAI